MACTTRTWGFSACEKTEKRWHRNSCCHKFVKVFECIEGSLSVWLWPPFDRDKGNQRQILLLKKFQIIKGVLFDPFSLGQKAQLITVFGSKRGTKECRKESCYSWEKIEIFGRTGIHTCQNRPLRGWRMFWSAVILYDLYSMESIKIKVRVIVAAVSRQGYEQLRRAYSQPCFRRSWVIHEETKLQMSGVDVRRCIISPTLSVDNLTSSYCL